MADGVTLNPGVGGVVMATDEIGGAHYERVKITQGADGVNDGDVSSTNPLHTRESGAAAATVSAVNDSSTSATLLASNAARRGATFYNDSTEPLYLKFGATASVSSFTRKMLAGEFFSLPSPLYTGVIDGIWEQDGAGACRITEW